MAARTKTRERVDALATGVSSYELQARAIYDEARRAAALIPPREFEDVFQAAPEMEYHHRFVQSVLTWIWYEVHENEVALENLPDVMQGFFLTFEGPFARYWM
jgi:hypothetical protein